jgi:hypothetical protein
MGASFSIIFDVHNGYYNVTANLKKITIMIIAITFILVFLFFLVKMIFYFNPLKILY